MAATVAVPETADIGLIGLGVMGENLARNMADHGYRVALWTRSAGKVDRLIQQHGVGRQWVNPTTLEDFTRNLALPRRVLLMVKAGAPVDEMLAKLMPLLSPDDVVIDGGNSFFRDTERRAAALRECRLHFVGMGVSGGEQGARYGPSLMPGGTRPAYEVLRPILTAIAAKTEAGPSVTYVGPAGAGHFVKMVHNGIEYGNMQLISEAYDLLRRVVGLSAPELSDLFAKWNRGPLEAYLIEITSRVLAARDPETGRPLVDLVLDQAGQQGTGSWTVQIALELGVPIPTIAAAVDARILSSMRAERLRASRSLAASRPDDFAGDRTALVDSIHDALSAATICSYAQGMSLLRAASAEYRWGVALREIARIWKGGCIIRARLLDTIMQAFDRDPDLPNLVLDPDIRTRVLKAEPSWRRTLHTAVELGVPVPALSASLAYFDSYRTAALPQNLTQAQRDYFGAHTYQRADRPEDGFVHTDWEKLIEQTPMGGAQR
jgi:6-phosphogluconate dehydrogenase